MKTKILTAAFVIFSLASLVYALTLSLGITNTVALTGATNVSVPVTLSNNLSVSIFEFDVNYTSNADFVGVQPTSRMPNATIEWRKLSATQVKIAALVPDGVTAGSGTLMNLKFDIYPSATPGIYDMKAGNEIFLNENETFSMDITNGLLTII